MSFFHKKFPYLGKYFIEHRTALFVVISSQLLQAGLIFFSAVFLLKNHLNSQLNIIILSSLASMVLALYLLEKWILSGITESIYFSIRKELCAALFVKEGARFKEFEQSSNFLNALREVNKISPFFEQGFAVVFKKLPLIALFSILLLWTKPSGGIYFLSTALILLSIEIYFKALVSKKSEELEESQNHLSENIKIIYDKFEEIKEIARKHSLEQISRNIQKFSVSQKRSVATANILWHASSILARLIIFFVALSRGEIGSAIFVQQYLIFEIILLIGRHVSSFMVEYPKCARALNTVQETHRLIAEAHRLFLYKVPFIRPKIKSKREVVDDLAFRKVNFSSSGEKVFKDFDFIFPKGRVTAVVGMGQQDAMDFSRLLNNRHNKLEGKIFLDGVNVQEFSEEEAASITRVYPEEPIYFSGCSVRQNLLFLSQESLSDETLAAALKMVYADDLTSDLDSLKILSKEQQKQVHLARAFLNHQSTIHFFLDPEKHLSKAAMRKFSESLIKLAGKDKLVFFTTKNPDDLHYILFFGDNTTVSLPNELMRFNSKYQSMFNPKNSEINIQ